MSAFEAVEAASERLRAALGKPAGESVTELEVIARGRDEPAVRAAADELDRALRDLGTRAVARADALRAAADALRSLSDE